MEMKVRSFLSTIDPVVLKREYSEGPVGLDERLCNSLGRCQYGLALPVGKIEQQRNMSACDNAALANFKLPRIDHGQCMFVLFQDLPSFVANCQAKVAWISDGKFDHLILRSSGVVPSGET